MSFEFLNSPPSPQKRESRSRDWYQCTRREVLRAARWAVWSPVIIIALVVVLSGCGAASAMGRSSAAAPSPLVHLPADQAGHPSVQNEWWYVVGHLKSGTHRFGYQFTVFKLHNFLVPGFTSAVNIFRTDLAITDETAKRFYHQITYYFPQSASVSTKGLNVQVGTAALNGPSASDMALRGAFQKDGFDLHLSSLRPPMYVGGRGYLSFADGFTYYYSLTHLATSGSIKLAGRSYAVSGISWLDHQWGNWNWSSVRGWTWMAWQLSNGVQMSVFDFRSSATHVKAASVLLANGKLRTLRRLTMTPTGTWKSPHTGGVYPSGWVVRVPALKIVMRVKPTVRDQEMTESASRRAAYWEGSSVVRGTFSGKAVSGLGYTELTGYAGQGAP